MIAMSSTIFVNSDRLFSEIKRSAEVLSIERIFEECCSVLAGRLQSGVLFCFRMGSLALWPAASDSQETF
jgi:hypothetical protein